MLKYNERLFLTRAGLLIRRKFGMSKPKFYNLLDIRENNIFAVNANVLMMGVNGALRTAATTDSHEKIQKALGKDYQRRVMIATFYPICHLAWWYDLKKDPSTGIVSLADWEEFFLTYPGYQQLPITEQLINAMLSTGHVVESPEIGTIKTNYIWEPTNLSYWLNPALLGGNTVGEWINDRFNSPRPMSDLKSCATHLGWKVSYADFKLSSSHAVQPQSFGNVCVTNSSTPGATEVDTYNDLLVSDVDRAFGLVINNTSILTGTEDLLSQGDIFTKATILDSVVVWDGTPVVSATSTESTILGKYGLKSSDETDGYVQRRVFIPNIAPEVTNLIPEVIFGVPTFFGLLGGSKSPEPDLYPDMGDFSPRGGSSSPNQKTQPTKPQQQIKGSFSRKLEPGLRAQITGAQAYTSSKEGPISHVIELENEAYENIDTAQRKTSTILNVARGLTRKVSNLSGAALKTAVKAAAVELTNNALGVKRSVNNAQTYINGIAISANQMVDIRNVLRLGNT